MGRRGPKPWHPVPAGEVLRELGVPPFRRRRMERRPDSAELVEETIGLTADWFTPDLEVRSLPMPRGGYRQLVRCPGCERYVLRLYMPGAIGPTTDRAERWRCRHCFGLRYASQYSGRRPGASEERLVTLLESIRRARCETVQDRRTDRLMATLRSLQEREARWIRRFMAETDGWWKQAQRDFPEQFDMA